MVHLSIIRSLQGLSRPESITQLTQPPHPVNNPAKADTTPVNPIVQVCDEDSWFGLRLGDQCMGALCVGAIRGRIHAL